METELIAQVGVTQQHFHLRCTGRLIDMVRALPTDDVLGTFGEDGLVTQFIQLISRLVCVQQLGIPNRLRLNAEDRLDQVALTLQLLFHLLFVILRSQGISIRRSEELDAFGSG